MWSLYVSNWLLSAEQCSPEAQETKGTDFEEWLNAEPLSEVMEQSEDKQPSWSY